MIERQVGSTIDVATRESYFGDTMFVYRTREHPPATLLPDRLRRYCDEVCDRWAIEDLNQLLSYIYFETPPMIGAARGEQLNMWRVREVEWPAYYPTGPLALWNPCAHKRAGSHRP